MSGDSALTGSKFGCSPEVGVTRAAERLSARGRSKRLLVEPGVTAARIYHFSGCRRVRVRTSVEEVGARQACAGREFVGRESEPVRSGSEFGCALGAGEV